MGINKKPYVMSFILILIGAFLVLNVPSAKAGDDDLDLTGIIKSVDEKQGTVTIKVLSSGCEGIKKFNYHDTLKASENIGKKVRFALDSEICNGNEIYRIKRIYYRWYDLSGERK